MSIPSDPFVHRLSGAISFPSTLQGNRQHRAWVRLINNIRSSTSTSEFDKAAAYVEGYAHALVDSGQIDISTDRDLLIIVTVDAWRSSRVLA